MRQADTQETMIHQQAEKAQILHFNEKAFIEFFDKNRIELSEEQREQGRKEAGRRKWFFSRQSIKIGIFQGFEIGGVLFLVARKAFFP